MVGHVGRALLPAHLQLPGSGADPRVQISRTMWCSPRALAIEETAGTGVQYSYGSHHAVSVPPRHSRSLLLAFVGSK